MADSDPTTQFARFHRSVAAILRKHGIDESLVNDHLCTLLLCNLDEHYVEVFEREDGSLFLRPVDLEGAKSRSGRADRERLLDVADLARKLVRSMRSLSDADMRHPMREAQVREKLDSLSIDDVLKHIKSLENAIRSVVEDMGAPPTKRRGNRPPAAAEAQLRMRRVLHDAGISDDSICASIISDIFAITGRGSHSVEAIRKRFRRRRQK